MNNRETRTSFDGVQCWRGWVMSNRGSQTGPVHGQWISVPGTWLSKSKFGLPRTVFNRLHPVNIVLRDKCALL